jgi:hypothetical protein
VVVFNVDSDQHAAGEFPRDHDVNQVLQGRERGAAAADEESGLRLRCPVRR